MSKKLLLTLLILGVITISGYILNENTSTTANNQTQSSQLGQVVPAVMKACFDGKPQPYNYATISCNGGTTCNIDFKNEIYLRIVPSGSMCPTEFIGDYMVFMRTSGNTDFKIGDILNYQRLGSDVAHRVVAYCDGGYVLRGDFNNQDDSGCIKYSEIIGVQVAIIKGIK